MGIGGEKNGPIGRQVLKIKKQNSLRQGTGQPDQRLLTAIEKA